MKKQFFWLGLAGLFFGEVGAAQGSVYDWPTILGEEIQYFKTPEKQELFYFNASPEIVYILSELSEIEKKILKKNIENERKYSDLYRDSALTGDKTAKLNYDHHVETLNTFLQKLPATARVVQGGGRFYDPVLGRAVNDAKESLAALCTEKSSKNQESVPGATKKKVSSLKSAFENKPTESKKPPVHKKSPQDLLAEQNAYILEQRKISREATRLREAACLLEAEQVRQAAAQLQVSLAAAAQDDDGEDLALVPNGMADLDFGDIGSEA